METDTAENVLGESLFCIFVFLVGIAFLKYQI